MRFETQAKVLLVKAGIHVKRSDPPFWVKVSTDVAGPQDYQFCVDLPEDLPCIEVTTNLAQLPGWIQAILPASRLSCTNVRLYLTANGFMVEVVVATDSASGREASLHHWIEENCLDAQQLRNLFEAVL